MLSLTLYLAIVAAAPIVPVAPPVEHGDHERTKALRLSLAGAPHGFEELLSEVLKHHGIVISPDEHDGSVAVKIQPWSKGGLDGWAYELDLSRDGNRVGDLYNQVCVGCSIGDLARDVAGYVAGMAEGLPPPAEPKEPAKVAPVPTPLVAPPREPAPPRRAPSVAFLASGVPILAVGSAVFAGGIVLVARGEVISPSPQGDAFIMVSDYRPPGITMMVTGAVGMVAGAVLTGIGIHRRGRERARKIGRLTSLLPRCANPGSLSPAPVVSARAERD
jgi:hypothetical protein